MADEVSWRSIWHVSAPTESGIPCGSGRISWNYKNFVFNCCYTGKQGEETVDHFFNHCWVEKVLSTMGFFFSSLFLYILGYSLLDD